MRPPSPRDEAGFTLIETLTVTILFGLVATMTVFGWKSFSASLAQGGTQREVVSELRAVQQRAVTEDTSYCVDFGGTSSTSWTVWRTPNADQGSVYASCSAWPSATQVGTFKAQTNVTLTNVDFNQRDGSDKTFVLFYPRGAATSGSLRVTRQNSGTVNTISVEGLTARVSSTGA